MSQEKQKDEFSAMVVWSEVDYYNGSSAIKDSESLERKSPLHSALLFNLLSLSAQPKHSSDLQFHSVLEACYYHTAPFSSIFVGSVDIEQPRPHSKI